MSFVFGTVVGSFLNVVIYRLPHGKSVVSPPSSCPKCGERIAFYDNIPLVSWLLLGARCRKCKVPIPWRYPFVEALTGLLFLGVYWSHGLVVATPVFMILGASLIVVTFVDIDHWIIPNEITFPGIPLGIVWGLFVMAMPDLSGGVIPQAYETVFDALLGIVVGGGSLYLMDKISLVFLGKRGMGFGDVKLLAMLGAFFGWQSVIFIIMCASVIGSVLGTTMIVMNRSNEEDGEESEETEEEDKDESPLLDDDDEELPEGHYLQFGPCLAVAGIIVMLFGTQISNYVYSNIIFMPGVTPGY